MGVPLSNFTVLKYLADGMEKEKANHRSFEMEYALEAMEDYSVFAFVLHDPVVHKDFHEFFGKQFSSMHYSSGQHLVFFGLVDSPKKYLLTGNRPFYNDVRDAVDWVESEEKNEEDNSYSAFALANSLKIEPDMLPVIVVTHDPRSANYKWYRTCPDQLEKQMNRLTGISNQMVHFKRDSPFTLEQKQNILFKLLDEQELDLCKGMGTTKLNESMARALSDILSFLIQNENLTSSYSNRQADILKISTKHSRTALDTALRSLQALKKSMRELEMKDSNENEFQLIIEDLYTNIGIFLSILQKNQRNSPKPLPTLSIKESWLEDHSKHLLHTGLDVEAFLMNSRLPLDYSPSAICLAKMFEREINLSIVHWIRKQHSIDLPEYFNRYQRGIKALISANFHSGPGSPVDFNLERNGMWQPPELGKSKNIARYNLTQQDWHSFGIDHSLSFLSQWDIIQQIRNKAAHTGTVSLFDLNDMKKSLTILADTNIFDRLAHLKNIFKNNPA